MVEHGTLLQKDGARQLEWTIGFLPKERFRELLQIPVAGRRRDVKKKKKRPASFSSPCPPCLRGGPSCNPRSITVSARCAFAANRYNRRAVNSGGRFSGVADKEDEGGLRAVRLEKLDALRTLGVEAYPYSLPVTAMAADLARR